MFDDLTPVGGAVTLNINLPRSLFNQIKASNVSSEINGSLKIAHLF